MSIFTLVDQIFQHTETIFIIAHGFNQFFISIKLLIALFGTVTIFVGAILAIYRYIRHCLLPWKKGTIGIRLNFARSIILGLEFFVAADVIETVIAPDFSSLAILGILVIIRTILNYSMEREIRNLSLLRHKSDSLH